jgi:hypothetical protein
MRRKADRECRVGNEYAVLKSDVACGYVSITQMFSG